MEPRYVYIDAGTGRYVTEEYARANPNTTVRYRLVHDPLPSAFVSLLEAYKNYQKHK